MKSFLPENLRSFSSGTRFLSSWMYFAGSAATPRFRLPSRWHRSIEFLMSP